jgi:hypothetical protein
MSFIQASLEGTAWLDALAGTFDAVISARALHHFTENQRWVPQNRFKTVVRIAHLRKSAASRFEA